MTSRSATRRLSLCALVGLVTAGAQSCNITKTGNPGNSDPIGGKSLVKELAKECGLDIGCETGLADGYAAISGVQAVDSYFSSVVRFKAEADVLSSALEYELASLRNMLGVEPNADLETELRRRIAASTDGSLRYRADVPRCEITKDALLAAQKRCEGQVDAGEEVECYGRCELPSGAEVTCDGTAELACTSLAGASRCPGECKGRCTTELSAPAPCTGVCRGTCNGTCSLYSDSAADACAGLCDGVCTGTCEVEQVASARCDGACTGECTVASSNGSCEGAASASCQAAPASFVLCAGRCEGEIQLRRATAECDPVVKAEAKMSVRCSMPRVSIDYVLKAGLDAGEREQFAFDMRTLEQRLPVLLMTLARAEETLNAGTELARNVNRLTAAAQSAVKGDASVRVKFGVFCAVTEAGAIPGFVGAAADRLSQSTADAISVTNVLAMP